jgi:hypothetical protein
MNGIGVISVAMVYLFACALGEPILVTKSATTIAARPKFFLRFLPLLCLHHPFIASLRENTTYDTSLFPQRLFVFLACVGVPRHQTFGVAFVRQWGHYTKRKRWRLLLAAFGNDAPVLKKMQCNHRKNEPISL